MTPTQPEKANQLSLANALSACVLSGKLQSQHRQWAAQTLVRSVISEWSEARCLNPGTMADLCGEMPVCPISKLEAHQNRVLKCTFNSRKNLLATR